MCRRFTILFVAIFLINTRAHAQTLAHPGWHGNGFASQAWWKHTNFVRFSPAVTFTEAAHALDSLAEAGVDSMILPDLEPAADAAAPFHERFGTADDLDALLREASARHMHVLVTMPVSRLSVGGGEVRFWMTRGIAGFDVGSVGGGDLSVLRGVRSAMARFPGERILLGQTPKETSPAGHDLLRDPITLHVVSSPAAASSKSDLQAVAITSWEGSASTVPPRTALIFDATLLLHEGGAAKAHALLLERGRRRSR